MCANEQFSFDFSLTYSSLGVLYKASFRILEPGITAFSRKSSSKLEGGIRCGNTEGGTASVTYHPPVVLRLQNGKKVTDSIYFVP